MPRPGKAALWCLPQGVLEPEELEFQVFEPSQPVPAGRAAIEKEEDNTHQLQRRANGEGKGDCSLKGDNGDDSG